MGLNKKRFNKRLFKRFNKKLWKMVMTEAVLTQNDAKRSLHQKRLFISE